MPYQFLEDVAIADIAFEAWGNDLEEVFAAAADATLNVMIEDLDSVQPRESRPLDLDAGALDLLLFNFLQELIYYKDAERLLLRALELRIEPLKDRWVLRAVARGERLDPARHRQRVDVKAVTLHRFQLDHTDQGWHAFVILDI